MAIAGRGQARLDAAVAACPGPMPLAARVCDVADRRQVQALVEWFQQQWGPPEILVNSAGTNVVRRSMAELDPDDWDRLLAINVTGAFNCMHAVLPGMRQRGSGLIVNISSVAGKRAGKLGGVGYCARNSP